MEYDEFDDVYYFHYEPENFAGVSWWKPFPKDAYGERCIFCLNAGPEFLRHRAEVRYEHLIATKNLGWVDSRPILSWLLNHLCLGLEWTFQTAEKGWDFPMKALVWIAAIAVLLIPAIYLFQHPDATLTTSTQLLKDVLLFLLTILGTYLSTSAAARRQANNKWVPQARSSCRTLLSLWADTRRLQHELANLCSTVTKELPVMEENKFQGARAALNMQCRAGANRLDSIADYLTNAVADWESFIGANCEGDECEKIWTELQQHRHQLEAQLAKAEPTEGCGNNSIQ